MPFPPTYWTSIKTGDPEDQDVQAVDINTLKELVLKLKKSLENTHKCSSDEIKKINNYDWRYSSGNYYFKISGSEDSPIQNIPGFASELKDKGLEKEGSYEESSDEESSSEESSSEDSSSEDSSDEESSDEESLEEDNNKAPKYWTSIQTGVPVESKNPPVDPNVLQKHIEEKISSTLKDPKVKTSELMEKLVKYNFDYRCDAQNGKHYFKDVNGRETVGLGKIIKVLSDLNHVTKIRVDFDDSFHRLKGLTFRKLKEKFLPPNTMPNMKTCWNDYLKHIESEYQSEAKKWIFFRTDPPGTISMESNINHEISVTDEELILPVLASRHPIPHDLDLYTTINHWTKLVSQVFFSKAALEVLRLVHQADPVKDEMRSEPRTSIPENSSSNFTLHKAAPHIEVLEEEEFSIVKAAFLSAKMRHRIGDEIFFTETVWWSSRAHEGRVGIIKSVRGDVYIVKVKGGERTVEVNRSQIRLREQMKCLCIRRGVDDQCQITNTQYAGSIIVGDKVVRLKPAVRCDPGIEFFIRFANARNVLLFTESPIGFRGNPEMLIPFCLFFLSELDAFEPTQEWTDHNFTSDRPIGEVRWNDQVEMWHGMVSPIECTETRRNVDTPVNQVVRRAIIVLLIKLEQTRENLLQKLQTQNFETRLASVLQNKLAMVSDVFVTPTLQQIARLACAGEEKQATLLKLAAFILRDQFPANDIFEGKDGISVEAQIVDMNHQFETFLHKSIMNAAQQLLSKESLRPMTKMLDPSRILAQRNFRQKCWDVISGKKEDYISRPDFVWSSRSNTEKDLKDKIFWIADAKWSYPNYRAGSKMPHPGDRDKTKILRDAQALPNCHAAILIYCEAIDKSDEVDGEVEDAISGHNASHKLFYEGKDEILLTTVAFKVSGFQQEMNKEEYWWDKFNTYVEEFVRDLILPIAYWSACWHNDSEIQRKIRRNALAGILREQRRKEAESLSWNWCDEIIGRTRLIQAVQGKSFPANLTFEEVDSFVNECWPEAKDGVHTHYLCIKYKDRLERVVLVKKDSGGRKVRIIYLDKSDRMDGGEFAIEEATLRDGILFADLNDQFKGDGNGSESIKLLDNEREAYYIRSDEQIWNGENIKKLSEKFLVCKTKKRDGADSIIERLRKKGYVIEYDDFRRMNHYACHCVHLRYLEDSYLEDVIFRFPIQERQKKESKTKTKAKNGNLLSCLTGKHVLDILHVSNRSTQGWYRGTADFNKNKFTYYKQQHLGKDNLEELKMSEEGVRWRYSKNYEDERDVMAQIGGKRRKTWIKCTITEVGDNEIYVDIPDPMTGKVKSDKINFAYEEWHYVYDPQEGPPNKKRKR